jgi:hypothetical protein
MARKRNRDQNAPSLPAVPLPTNGAPVLPELDQIAHFRDTAQPRVTFIQFRASYDEMEQIDAMGAAIGLKKRVDVIRAALDVLREAIRQRSEAAAATAAAVEA